MKDSKSKWIFVAILAAVVAAVTTVVLLLLRARAKRKAAWYDDADYTAPLTVDDFDVIEINEAFAAVPLVSCLGILGMDQKAMDEKVNVKAVL